MKVYIVTESSYNGESVIFVCADLHQAKLISDQYNQEADENWYKSYVEEYEVLE